MCAGVIATTTTAGVKFKLECGMHVETVGALFLLKNTTNSKLSENMWRTRTDQENKPVYLGS